MKRTDSHLLLEALADSYGKEPTFSRIFASRADT
jgi:hypothetical protein